MKIALRGMGSHRLIRQLEASGLARLVGGTHSDLFFDATWPSDELDEFLRAASKIGSFDLNPWMTFTRADVSRARFLRIRPRKVTEESDDDYETMRRRFDDLPWIGDDPMHRCRLPQEISLSRIKLKPDQVSVVGQWTAEYIVPNAVRRIFEEAALTGVEFRPIINTQSGAAFDDFAHLYTDHLLASRIIDVASPEIPSSHPEEQGYDVMGCLCYDAATLGDALDFNRTGESNVAFEFPEWIVSAKVRDVFAANKLKGWKFEPVLEAESDPFDDYVELWTSLFALVADCRKHTVRGRPV